MPTGIVHRDERGTLVRLLENLAAANTLADGAPGDKLSARPLSTQFFNLAELGPEFVWPDHSTVRIYETAGTGTMTIASARLMLYDSHSQKVFPAGPGADADKGKINLVAAFGETGSDQLRHSELLLYPGSCSGVQFMLGTFGGTNPTFNVDWFIPAPR